MGGADERAVRGEQPDEGGDLETQADVGDGVESLGREEGLVPAEVRGVGIINWV